MLQHTAVETERELIDPLLQFRHVGVPLTHGWTTIRNGAAFGTDYLTRTAVARSNIFVNQPQETSYFYQEYDGHGERLHGNHAYTLTFPKDGLPPARGFWSLTLYDNDHFFVPNPLKRYSLGTKNKGLQFQQDGSLTLSIQATAPEEEKHANWLPAPQDTFELYLRVYWPQESVLTGQWEPPAVVPL